MLYKFLSSTLLAMVVVFTISCQQAAKTESQMENEYSGTVPGQQPLTPASPEHVAQRLGTFAPFTLTSDISHLSAKEKQILSILFDVADIMDGLFWQQAMGPKDAFLRGYRMKPPANLHWSTTAHGTVSMETSHSSLK